MKVEESIFEGIALPPNVDSKEMETAQRKLDVDRADAAAAKKSRKLESILMRLLPILSFGAGIVAGILVGVAANSSRSNNYPYGSAVVATCAQSPRLLNGWVTSGILSTIAFFLGFIIFGGFGVATMYGTYHR